MNLQHRRAILGSVAVALVACGDGVLPAGDAATDVPVTTDATTDAPPTGDVPDAVSPCPALEPTAGAACTTRDLTCEYGDDLRRHCRDRARCDGAMWSITPGHATNPTGAIAACTPAPPATCPATIDAASGQTCSVTDAACSYGGRICECSNCYEYPVGNRNVSTSLRQSIV